MKTAGDGIGLVKLVGPQTKNRGGWWGQITPLCSIQKEHVHPKVECLFHIWTAPHLQLWPLVSSPCATSVNKKIKK